MDFSRTTAVVVSILVMVSASLAGEQSAAPVGSPIPHLPAPSLIIPGKLVRGSTGVELDQLAERRTFRVCPPEGPKAPNCQFTQVSEALAQARPGDEVVVAPGVYRQGAVVAVDGVTLRGEPGAHLQDHPVEGKAALVIRGAKVVVDGIECSGISVPDRNGACIRIEGADLTVRNVYFHDNENGILSGPGGGTVLIEGSRFERNGREGYAHGVYIGNNVETLIFRHNAVLSTKDEGHGFKSRAHHTILEDNVIASLEGDDSRAIDIPNGGNVEIRRNLLEKGPNSKNSQMIGLALEGNLHPENKTVIEDNLILFDHQPSKLAETLSSIADLSPVKGQVILSSSPGPILFRDNVIIGAEQIGIEVPVGQNKVFRSRRAANLAPYPKADLPMLKSVLQH